MNELESRAEHLEGIVRQQAEANTRLQAVIDELQRQIAGRPAGSRRGSASSASTTPELIASPHTPALMDPLDIPISALPLFDTTGPSPATASALGLKYTSPPLDVQGANESLANDAWHGQMPSKPPMSYVELNAMPSLWT